MTEFKGKNGEGMRHSLSQPGASWRQVVAHLLGGDMEVGPADPAPAHFSFIWKFLSPRALFP